MTKLNDGRTAVRWLWRGLKKGDWLWLMLAVVIASATVTFVERLGNTAKESMVRKAAMNLGADTVLESSRPIADRWREQAQSLNLSVAESQTLVTMAQVVHDNEAGEFQMVRLKGVTPEVPLRATGDLPRIPAGSSQVWAEQALVPLMGLQTGPASRVVLGKKTFELAEAYASDQAGLGMSAFAYEMRIAMDQLAETGLKGPGSRVTYSLSVAGEAEAVQRFTQSVREADAPNLEVRSAQSPSQDLGQALDTAWQFLDLAGLSAVLVAGLSILIASRFYLGRWQNMIALMRALGATRARISRLFAVQLMALALGAALLGVLLGQALFMAITPVLAEYFDPLVLGDWFGVSVYGLLMGVLVLWSFAWQAFRRAVATPPVALLKSISDAVPVGHWLGSLGLILLVMAMISAGSWWVLGSVAVMAGLLYLASEALIWGLNRWQSHASGWLKLSVAALTRSPGLVRIQLMSIGLVLFVLMLMTFVRADLMTNWQLSLPADTPDTFVVNVQPDQKNAVQSLLQKQGIDTELVPMARGRLVAVDDQPIRAEDQETQRGKRLLQREANIAVLKTPPDYNRMVAQRSDRERAQSDLPQVSVEKGIAELYELTLGQTLTFDFSGQRQVYVIDSLRDVSWQSFRLNFFFVVEPQPEKALPISYLSNFAIDQSATTPQALMQSMGREAPGVLVIDAGRIMDQIQTIMRQASWAVSGLYGFTLAASLIVLLTATMASQQSRIQSWLLLRTLGASQATVLKVGLMEFALLGALAGLLAATFAQITGMLISQFVLEMTPQLSPLLWAISVVLGSAILVVMGWLTQRHYLQLSPNAMAQKWG
jgi:putative ABC transport system permease protein